MLMSSPGANKHYSKSVLSFLKSCVCVDGVSSYVLYARVSLCSLFLASSFVCFTDRLLLMFGKI